MHLEHYVSHDKGRTIDFIEMTLRSDFENAVATLRKKWEINSNSLTDDESTDTWLRFMENTELYSDVEKMLKTLGISTSWTDVVHQYVIDDDIYPYNDTSSQISRNSNGLVLCINLEDTSDITARIGPNTLQSDFEKAWKIIEKYRKHKPTRQRERKNFLRDYEIFRLAKNGASITEICNTVEKKYGGDLSYGNIKKIVSDFYNRLETPENERKELELISYV